MINFSNEKPTNPGFYYCRRGTYVTIAEVSKGSKDELFIELIGTADKFPIFMIDRTIEFAGPIEMPEGD